MVWGRSTLARLILRSSQLWRFDMAVLNGDAAKPNDVNELAAVTAALGRGDAAGSLTKLSDYLNWRASFDVGSRYLNDNATHLLGSLRDLERARREGLGQNEFTTRHGVILKETRLLLRRVSASVDAEDDLSPVADAASRTIVGAQGVSPAAIDEGAVLDARGVGKRHPGTGFVLSPIDLKVMPGQIVGIVGVNGSGKTTLLEILRGEIAPDFGEVHYPRLSPHRHDWRNIRAQIGYVPQRSVPWSGTVRHALEYACALHRIYGEDNERRVDRLLARHGLSAYQDHTWRQLSGGYRLRFDLVLARMHNPKLLILDEPLANLDPVSQQTFLEDLRHLARGEQISIRAGRNSNRAGTAQLETPGGVGVVLTSQHLFELEAVVGSDVIVLSGGRRVDIQRDRPVTYFEIWRKDLTRELVEMHLSVLRPDAAAGSGSGWDIRVGSTATIVALRKGTTVADLVRTASESGLPLDYVRDISSSARVELDELLEKAEATADTAQSRREGGA